MRDDPLLVQATPLGANAALAPAGGAPRVQRLTQSASEYICEQYNKVKLNDKRARLHRSDRSVPAFVGALVALSEIAHSSVAPQVWERQREPVEVDSRSRSTTDHTNEAHTLWA